MERNLIPKKSERLITSEEEESLLIFDSDSGSIKVLNKTAASIWENIDGEKSVEDLIDILVKENKDADRHTIEKDVFKFLKELQEVEFIK